MCRFVIEHITIGKKKKHCSSKKKTKTEKVGDDLILLLLLLLLLLVLVLVLVLLVLNFSHLSYGWEIFTYPGIIFTLMLLMSYIYIYDISSLRINDLTLILLTWRKR